MIICDPSRLRPDDRDELQAELLSLVCGCEVDRDCAHARAKAILDRGVRTAKDMALAYLWSERERAACYSLRHRRHKKRFVGPHVGQFRLIYADPPWEETGGGKTKRGCDRHYPPMKTRDIAALPVETLCSPEGAHLWMWVTNNFLEDGLLVLRAWGFRYVGIRSWFKGELDDEDDLLLQHAGLGQYTRGETEQLLLGVRRGEAGMLPYKLTADGKRCQVGTAIVSPKTSRHSEKPGSVRDDCLIVSYPPACELFARDVVPGFTPFGNEVQGGLQLVDISDGRTDQLRLFA